MLVIALLLLFFQSPGTALADPGSLSGTVTDNANNKISNALIEVINPANGQVVASATTDANGDFAMIVAPGTYYLYIWGYAFPSGIPWDWSGGYTGYQLWGPQLNIQQDQYLLLKLPNVYLSGTVTDPQGNPASAVVVQANQCCSFIAVNSLGFYSYINAYDTTDGQGQYNLWLLPAASYSVTAYPPPNLNLFPVIIGGVAVLQDTTLNISLVSPITLSGKLVDRDSNPLVGQNVQLCSQVCIYDTTDANGDFALGVTPGTYYLYIWGYAFPSGIPWDWSGGYTYYQLWAPHLNIQQDQYYLLKLPNVLVSGRVQDSFGNPIPGAAIQSYTCCPSQSIGGLTFYSYLNAYDSSNAAGRFDLWLLKGQYSIATYPPAGSGFFPFLLNQSITQDQNLVIVLQLTGAAGDSDNDGVPTPRTTARAFPTRTSSTPTAIAPATSAMPTTTTTATRTRTRLPRALTP